MNILAALTSGPAAFRGEGVNEEKEAFLGELRVQALEGGRAALLCYTATLPTGTVVHTESTLLGMGPSGKLCLWPVMSELPVILPHIEMPSGDEAEGKLKAIFSSGPSEESTAFREQITIQINPDGSLIYAHAWGLPGGPFEARSSCCMVPGEA